MRGALLRNLYLHSRNIHFSRYLKPPSANYNGFTSPCCKKYAVRNVQLLNSFPSTRRFFSSENGNPDSDSKPKSESSESKPQEENTAAAMAAANVEDVDSEELKKQIQDYLHGSNDNGEELPKIIDSILKKYPGKNEVAYEEFIDEFEEMLPPEDSDALENDEQSDDSDDAIDGEILESDFEEAVETDDEIGLLCDAEDVLMKRKASDPFFNMDDKKWDSMVKEAMENGYIRDTTECEQILEDIDNWDNILPDDIKQKVEEKFNEIGDRVEKGELSVEEGHELFKEFEDQIVLERVKQMEAEGPPEGDKDVYPSSEGPTLRWQTRVVFVPGGDSWHPKNRKVKLATTVKEYGLSKAQFVRLRELVGKRYNPAKDELTIISERFEHREENRKDCLRTLLALMNEARKAKDLVHEARVLDIKDRLKANPKFMQRLQSKKQAAELKPVAA